MSIVVEAVTVKMMGVLPDLLYKSLTSLLTQCN